MVDHVQRRPPTRQNELSGSVRREYSDARRDEVDEQNEVDAVPGLQRSGNRQSVSLLLVSFLLKVMRDELGLRRLYFHRQMQACIMICPACAVRDPYAGFLAECAVQFE